MSDSAQAIEKLGFANEIPLIGSNATFDEWKAVLRELILDSSKLSSFTKSTAKLTYELYGGATNQITISRLSKVIGAHSSRARLLRRVERFYNWAQSREDRLTKNANNAIQGLQAQIDEAALTALSSRSVFKRVLARSQPIVKKVLPSNSRTSIVGFAPSRVIHGNDYLEFVVKVSGGVYDFLEFSVLHLHSDRRLYIGFELVTESAGILINSLLSPIVDTELSDLESQTVQVPLRGIRIMEPSEDVILRFWSPRLQPFQLLLAVESKGGGAGVAHHFHPSPQFDEL